MNSVAEGAGSVIERDVVYRDYCRKTRSGHRNLRLN